MYNDNVLYALFKNKSSKLQIVLEGNISKQDFKVSSIDH